MEELKPNGTETLSNYVLLEHSHKPAAQTSRSLWLWVNYSTWLSNQICLNLIFAIRAPQGAAQDRSVGSAVKQRCLPPSFFLFSYCVSMKKENVKERFLPVLGQESWLVKLLAACECLLMEAGKKWNLCDLSCHKQTKATGWLTTALKGQRKRERTTRDGVNVMGHDSGWMFFVYNRSPEKPNSIQLRQNNRCHASSDPSIHSSILSSF